MDTESLLKSLNAHEVRYVVIGATAFPVHGYARATLDTDIFIDATSENATRTLAALEDAALRQMVRLALEPRGYEVLEASSTSDALDLFWRTNHTPALIITSADLAPLSGRSLLVRLREERPRLEAVLLGEGHVELPFEPAVLAAHVRSTLDGAE